MVIGADRRLIVKLGTFNTKMRAGIDAMHTGIIAEFICQTGYKEIPQGAIAIAKKHILDGLAVALRGSLEPASINVTKYVRGLGGKPEAGVIAGGFSTCVPQAALANGVTTHALDYDDYTTAWHGHPTAVILPTVLALGQREKASGAQVLAAFIIGWEIGAKVFAASGGLRLQEMGWHSTAIVGTMGAAAAAAKMLNLNEQQTRTALGIAGSQVGGLIKNSGTDTKPFHAGNAARSGVVAASLAQLGFSADENIMDGDLGLPMVLAREECDLSKLTDQLGREFSIVLPGAAIKPYPSCAATHRSIDAMLELVKRYRLEAKDVVEIKCRVHPKVTRGMRFHKPKTPLEAKFSLEYCVAAALLDGEVTPRQFTLEKVRSAKFQELIQMVRHDNADGYPTGPADTLSLPQTVAVKLRDGTEYLQEVLFPRGSPENPMGWDEVVAKFQDCIRGVLSTLEGNQVKNIVSNLDDVNDISELMRIATKRPESFTS